MMRRGRRGPRAIGLTVAALACVAWSKRADGQDAAARPWVADGFECTVFVEAPAIHSPASIAVSMDGAVFVAEDEYNSGFDRSPGLSRVKKCVDADGDGAADAIAVFCDGLYSPQGLTFVDGTLYVVHAPYLTAFRDRDRDDRADEAVDLVTGFGPPPEGLVHHIPSGVRMGIDGWLYVSVGDKGIHHAVGADGRTIQLHGGGIVRVRPDGTGLEVYATGLRNTLDVAVDPLMNLFTRDNTNDGGGWNVRLSHIQSGGEYGYPSLFVNFADEIVPAIADYGGGSGTGCMFVSEPASLPAGFGNRLYTTDWGRGAVYRHVLTPAGATFAAEQHDFFVSGRPVDIDVDGAGRLFVCDWGERGWGDVKEEGIKGAVYCVRAMGPTEPPPGETSGASSHRARASEADLDVMLAADMIACLRSPSHTLRLNAQRALLRRWPGEGAARPMLQEVVEDFALPGENRVAALYTYAQMFGAAWAAPEGLDPAVAYGYGLASFLDIEELREHAIRALSDCADRRAAMTAEEAFVPHLTSADPGVREQAAIALGRSAEAGVAAHLVPLTADEDGMVRHAAMHALRQLAATDAVAVAKACARAVCDESSSMAVALGALRALGGVHDLAAVDALAELVATSRNDERNGAILAALARLCHREGPWDGSWWGTQPSTRGPYYDRATWAGSARASEALANAARRLNEPDVARAALERIAWHGIDECAPTVAALFLESTPEVESLREDVARALVELDSGDRFVIKALGAIGLDAALDVDLRAAAITRLARQAGEVEGASAVLDLAERIAAARTAGDTPQAVDAPLTKAVAGAVAAISCRASPVAHRLGAMARATDHPFQAEAIAALIVNANTESAQLLERALEREPNAEAILRALLLVPVEHVSFGEHLLDDALLADDERLRRAALAVVGRADAARYLPSLAVLLERGVETAAVAETVLTLRSLDAAPENARADLARLLCSTVHADFEARGQADDELLAATQKAVRAAPWPEEEKAREIGTILHRAGILTRFAVLGPLPPLGGQTPFASIYPEVENDPGGPPLPLTRGGTTYEWRDATTHDERGVLRLNELFGTMEPFAAYAAASFESPRDASATLLVGSDDGVVVWVNGEKVLERDVYRPVNLYDDQAAIHLRAGSNSLLFKVTNTALHSGLATRVRLDGVGGPGATVAELGYDQARQRILASTDPPARDHEEAPSDHDTMERAAILETGRQLFVSLSCAQCHTINPGEPPRGPYLGDAGLRFSREHLVDSVLTPGMSVAQGFRTQVFKVRAENATYGETEEIGGFVTRESGPEVEVRDLTGRVFTVAKSRIVERGERGESSMPAGLADRIRVEEFAALLDYLQSLQNEQ